MPASPPHRRPKAAAVAPRAASSSDRCAAANAPGYWKPRLIQRRYSNESCPAIPGELSAHIESSPAGFFFPLGTSEIDAGARQAARIHSVLAQEGWAAVTRQFAREFTIAIFWNWSPIACTYTTLRTHSDPAASAPASPQDRVGASCPVWLVEPDPSFRAAIAQCMHLQHGFRCAASAESFEQLQALHPPQQPPPKLVLANRTLFERGPSAGIPPLTRALLGQAPIFRFGIHDDSNYIFHSVSGVAAGYILRRRGPRECLDPIALLGRDPNLSSNKIRREIQKYFQNLFAQDSAQSDDALISQLTRRECEILDCLSRGLTDKEIAQTLGISPWTVHGHVKSVFEKLGVHSRTEAVVKFLAK